MRRWCVGLLLATTFQITWADKDVPLEVQRLRAKLAALQHHTLPPSAPTYTFYPGSLKENITALASQCGWHTVVWEPDYDYQWVGITRFQHQDIKQILGRVLSDFPLQATFYTGNHVLVISPRALG